MGVLESRAPHWPPATAALTAWIPPDRAQKHDDPSPRWGHRVVLLCDPPGTADALTFIYMAGILHVAGVRTTAIVPRGAARLERALRHVRGGGYVERLEVLDGSVLAEPGRFDLAVCLPMEDDASTAEPSFATKLAVVTTACHGLPVVVRDSHWARGLLPEGAHKCLTPSLDSSRLARVVFELLAEPVLERTRAALREGLRSPGRSLTDEVVAAWSLGAAAGAPA
jgi:hypothetical protein